MRLSEGKIKQGITHDEKYVRDMAVSYFANSFSGDRTVMPVVTETLDNFGFLNAFSDVDLLQNLAQSDKTITWLTREISRLGGTSDQRQWEYVGSLSWILAESEAGLLKRRRKEILELRFLDASVRNTIEQRTRLLTANPDTCWTEFNECCRQLGAGGPSASADVLAKAYHLLEAISYHPQKFSDRLLAMISEESPPDSDLSRRWQQVCAIRATGQMGLTVAVPHLIRLLQTLNEDWVYEECVLALTRIGSDAVVKAVWNACALAEGNFHDYAAWVLEGIHSDLSEQAAIQLFHHADDVPTKIAFGHALLSDFAIDGITAVRDLIRHEDDAEEMGELQHALMAVCTLAEADFPELKDWREKIQEEQSFREKWQSPEFPVVDTWSSQLTDTAPPQRSDGLGPLPIRIPKPRQFRGVGRNEPCPCNSGKKFKNCCMRSN